MSLAHALEFIQLVRRDAALRARVEEMGRQATLEALVRLGAERELLFSADELQDAFRHDWMMRRVRLNQSKS